MTESASTDGWLERMRAVPRPKVGARVERDHQLTGEPVPGVVVAVGDDLHAFGGWVAVVRFWIKGRRRHSWEVVQANDLAPLSGCEPRVRVKKR